MTNHHDQRQPTHVVIIGLPFCGKTLVGQRLARLLRRPFFDSDTAVSLAEHRVGTGTSGHEHLLAREREWFDSMLELTAPSVVAAPASVLDRDPGWKDDRMWVVWIDSPIEMITDRLRAGQGGGLEELRARIRSVTASAPTRRERAAEIADLCLDADDEDAATLAQRVVDAFADRFPAPASSRS